MHRRCTADVSDASATSAWRKGGPTSSRIGDASATWHDPSTPSTPTPSRRPRVLVAPSGR
eukprot:1080088-Pyramimonas_sp.AAC.1